MAEYIEREALKERFRKRIEWLKKDVHDQYSLGLFHGCEYDADLINAPLAADVAPVRHGRWLPFHSTAAGDIQYCSACEIGCTWKPNYCPNCGAKMEGE